MIYFLIVPLRMLREIYSCVKLSRRARQLRKTAESHPGGLPALLERVLSHPKFPVQQKPKEFLGLLKLLEPLKPLRILEIGSKDGGSLFLFCRVASPDARLLSMDLEAPFARRMAHRNLARPGQRVTCLKADSHSPETLRRVERWLAGERLDFLFIDGDHSLAGVTRDYELYSPLVREGGLTALHDIVPDFKTRHGIETAACAGEVHRFWRELKRREPNTIEFIEDPAQDGFGIGVVIKQ